MSINMPALHRHVGGKYYIHWTSKGRSIRTSTKTNCRYEALHFFANWIGGHIPRQAPPVNMAEIDERVRRIRASMAVRQ